MMGGLDGKVVVVTGGASGIGLAAANRLRADGARVAIWDVAQRQPGGGTLDLIVDVSDQNAVSTALSETQDRLGAPDILVTCAGIVGATRPLIDQTLADWHRVINVNLLGVFLCCQAVLPGMAARNWGRIITVSSMAGKDGNPNASIYSAAKAGVIGLTKSLGKEMAMTGVRVNSITPGLIDTPQVEQLPKAQIARALASIPMGRLGSVEEAASLIAWLCSDECSFNSGAIFDLSGGRATY